MTESTKESIIVRGESGAHVPCKYDTGFRPRYVGECIDFSTW